ncbi:MAG: inositol monophosphatase family protein [Gemmatales bacterium]|nr:histidinol phosphate phosphatase [Gemmatales bacterium]MDW8176204.1 inositol monophosphatase family protein [Gemmatales bacterium]
MKSEWRTRYEAGVQAAEHAARLALRYYDQGDLPVEWKSNLSPVTVADREAEIALREALLTRFPQDGFWGEEFGQQPGSSGYRWIIDPIDGTRNFVRGIPLWGTLVALEYRGEPIAGVVVFPALGLVYRALRGDGAFRNERPIRVSAVKQLAEGMLFYSGASWFLASGCREAFVQMCLRSQRQRGFGDCYGFALIAQGSGEAMIDYGVHPWDVAAIVPIVEEAGGQFTDWSGQRTFLRPDVLASNGQVHAEILGILSQHCARDFDPQHLAESHRIT